MVAAQRLSYSLNISIIPYTILFVKRNHVKTLSNFREKRGFFLVICLWFGMGREQGLHRQPLTSATQGADDHPTAKALPRQVHIGERNRRVAELLARQAIEGDLNAARARHGAKVDLGTSRLFVLGLQFVERLIQRQLEGGYSCTL